MVDRANASQFGRQNSRRRAPTRGGGHPQGVPLLLFSAKKPASSRQRRMEFAIAHYDLHSSRRYALRRAPTRGAPTRFRQPHEVFSNLMQLPWDGGWWPRPERRWRDGLLEGGVLRCLNQDLQDLGIFMIAGDRSGAGTAGARGQGAGDSGRKTVRRWRGG